MTDKLNKLKQFVLEKIEAYRLKIATHPKTVMWRLKLFGVHPLLSLHFLKIAGGAIFVLLLFGIFYALAWRSPRPFPEQALITIEKGEPLSQIADSFEGAGIIRSDFWLKVFIFFSGGQKRVVAGDYYFPEAVSIFRVVKMLRSGEFGLISKRITLPEGTSSFEMAEILARELPAFDPKDFIDEVQDNGYEGYLFPDTYFFMPNTKIADIISMMRENFARQIKEYEEDIAESGRSLSDLVVMASIIEDEANGTVESKRVVSGILWKRLRLKMPLQVDAPFQYYNGKNSYTLTMEDLAEEHEYNTYVNLGLPPTAITNAGLDSLRAAIAPTNTSYLYFLSDKKGNMYYAKDFDGHKKNRELYLD